MSTGFGNGGNNGNNGNNNIFGNRYTQQQMDDYAEKQFQEQLEKILEESKKEAEKDAPQLIATTTTFTQNKDIPYQKNKVEFKSPEDQEFEAALYESNTQNSELLKEVETCLKIILNETEPKKSDTLKLTDKNKIEPISKSLTKQLPSYLVTYPDSQKIVTTKNLKKLQNFISAYLKIDKEVERLIISKLIQDLRSPKKETAIVAFVELLNNDIPAYLKKYKAIKDELAKKLLTEKSQPQEVIDEIIEKTINDFELPHLRKEFNEKNTQKFKAHREYVEAIKNKKNPTKEVLNPIHEFNETYEKELKMEEGFSEFSETVIKQMSIHDMFAVVATMMELKDFYAKNMKPKLAEYTKENARRIIQLGKFTYDNSHFVKVVNNIGRYAKSIEMDVTQKDVIDHFKNLIKNQTLEENFDLFGEFFNNPDKVVRKFVMDIHFTKHPEMKEKYKQKIKELRKQKQSSSTSTTTTTTTQSNVNKRKDPPVDPEKLTKDIKQSLRLLCGIPASEKDKLFLEFLQMNELFNEMALTSIEQYSKTKPPITLEGLQEFLKPAPKPPVTTAFDQSKKSKMTIVDDLDDDLDLNDDSEEEEILASTKTTIKRKLDTQDSETENEEKSNNDDSDDNNNNSNAKKRKPPKQMKKK